MLQSPDIRQRKQVMAVALGRAPADLVVHNAALLNVFSGEVLSDTTIAVCDRWVAWVGRNGQPTIGPYTQVIDAGGKTAIPGLIDGHTHLAWLFRIDAFLEKVIPGGTTTIVTETLEPYPVGGVAGVVDFLDSLTNQPIKILATAPPMVSNSRVARGIQPADLEALLERDDILGLGETYWQAALQEPDIYLPLMQQTLAAGKCLEGHSAGASYDKLCAYASLGISSCHEPITADEALQRLRLGLWVMIREGSIRRDLEAISSLKARDLDYRRLVLVTDGVSPQELLAQGYMETVVQRAIDYGLNPVKAIQMATLNVAEHFGLDGHIGAVAPGKQADFLIIPDLNTIRPEVVVSMGKVIARNGSAVMPPRVHVYSDRSRKSVKIACNLPGEHFAIPASGSEARMRAIAMVTDLVTREVEVTLPVENGLVQIGSQADIVKVAAVDRTLSPGKTFTGLIQGFGLHHGAFACSAGWDTTDIVVIGANDADMARCVNRIADLQGAVVISMGGEVTAELALPLFGLISDLPIDRLAAELDAITESVRDLGVSFRDPLLSLIALTGAAIPFFRICEEGYVRLKNGETVGLFA